MNLLDVSSHAKVAFMAMVVSSLAACSVAPKVSTEELVRARAEKRWESLIAGKIADAYGMTTLAYQNENSLDSFRSKLSGFLRWTGAEVISVKCDSDSCNVRLRIDAMVSMGTGYNGPINSAVDEKWVYEAGRWSFVPPN